MKNQSLLPLRLSALLPGFLAAAGLACGSDTGEARVTLPVEVTAERPAPGGLGSPASDAEVTLEHARFAAEAVTFFEGDPLFSRAPINPIYRLGQRVFGTRAAFAHPGHYTPGESLADLSTSVDVDLLGPPRLWGMADGVTGDYRSARLSGVTLELGGTVRSVVATSTEARPFSVSVTLFEPVLGIEARGRVEAAGASARIVVDLASLIERIPFDLTAADPLSEGSRAHNALLRGVESTSTYRIELVVGP